MNYEPDYTYWAGVLDAAGCIRMKKTPTGAMAPYMCLRSKNTGLIRGLKRVFGGSVSRGWTTSHSNAVRVVKLLYPYMLREVDPAFLSWSPGRRGPLGARRVTFMGGEE